MSMDTGPCQTRQRQRLDSFLPFFDSHIAELVGARRSGGFRAMIAAVEAALVCSTEKLVLVETGGLRQLENWLGDGQSTRIFDAFRNLSTSLRQLVRNIY